MKQQGLIICLSGMLLALVSVASTATSSSVALGALPLGAWENPTQMPIPKAQATAVTDPVTGRIYIAGGYGPGSYRGFSTMDVYDPVTNSWSAASNMPTGLRGAAGAYHGGKVFLFGGWRDYEGNKQIVQIYDIATNTWEQRDFAPGKWESSAAPADERLYVFGGQTGNTQQTIEFDPSTYTYAYKSDMGTGRLAHEAALLRGDLYVFGGCHNDGEPLIDDVEKYDPVSDTWSSTPTDMPTTRVQFAGGIVGGYYLAAGGSTVYTNRSAPFLNVLEVYDPDTNIWTEGPSLPEGLREAVGAVSGDRFYVFGGVDSGGYSSEVYSIIPEPATLSLLVWGGLALLRRKRGYGA